MAADQPAAPQAPATSPLLQTQQANAFTLAINAYEFLIGLGVSRMSVATIDNRPTANAVTEWVGTLSVSPVAATQLVALLQTSIKIYEERFGKIPTDPGFQLQAGSGG